MDEREQRAFLKVINKIEERKARRMHRAVAVACSTVCAAAVAFGVYFYSSAPVPVEVTETVFSCLEGGSSIVTLPDSSTVRLVGNATLVQRSDFSCCNRTVRLSGEALFDITSDAEHPFEILTPDDCTVKVFGTQFDLCAPADSGELTLVLLKGKVAFESRDVKCNVAPGEMIRYSSRTGNLKKNTISIDDYKMWMDGEVCYDNITLNELSKRLEGIYGVKIILSEELAQSLKTVSISLNNREDLPSVLEAIKALLPVNCESEEGTVLITLKNNNNIIC